MNKEEWAELLHIREYGSELSDAECGAARADRVLIVFGSSDDLTEFRGVEYEEYSHGTFFINHTGIVDSETSYKIATDYTNKGFIANTNAPHANFNILEEGELYGQGLVIDLNELKPKRKDVLILNSQSGDWEGLFIDGTLIDEGHHLGEGKSLMFLLEKAEEYNFTSKDVRFMETTDEDEDYLSCHGDFPRNLSELKGDYSHA
jgi:hypothetical protein